MPSQSPAISPGVELCLVGITKAHGQLMPLVPVEIQTASLSGPVTMIVCNFPIEAPPSPVSAKSSAVDPWLLQRLQRSMEKNPVTAILTMLNPMAAVLTNYIDLCRSWGGSKGGRTPFMSRTVLIWD
jgi:hypothetical protein